MTWTYVKETRAQLRERREQDLRITIDARKYYAARRRERIAARPGRVSRHAGALMNCLYGAQREIRLRRGPAPEKYPGQRTAYRRHIAAEVCG